MQELARMISGDKITELALANARECFGWQRLDSRAYFGYTIIHKCSDGNEYL